MYIFDNVYNLDLVDSYKNRIETHFISMCQYHNPMDWYPTRNIKLETTDPVVQHVTEFLHQRLRINTQCYEAELQTWPIGSDSELHNHLRKGYSRERGDYNSLLYLNDDFDGGEFYTANGLIIKPRKNRLTFFDGSDIYHGVKRVRGNNRFTIIFWWCNTRFLY